MSNYWKKKLDELNQADKKTSSTKKTSSDYWKSKMDELEKEEERKKIQSAINDIAADNDIAPVKVTMQERPSSAYTTTSLAPALVSKQILDERMQRRENEATATDIFGKETKKAQEERTVFKKSGVFEDGYDFGDITRTILGTAGDAVTGVAKGFVGSFEGITDLAAYGVAGIANKAGAEDFAEDVKRVAQRSQTDKIFGGFEKAADTDSVLGDKANTFAGGIGQILSLLAGGAAAKAAGWGSKAITALITAMTGTSSMGSGMSEAYQGGATDEQAVAYGAAKGVIDAGTELIAGGLGKAINAVGISRGIGGIDDIAAKKLADVATKKIGNEFWKTTISNAAEYGVKAAAEGAEEVLAGYGTAIAKKATYMSDEEFKQILEDENLLEQFVMGALAGGTVSLPGAVDATVAGKDYVTGYTQSEQKVIDAEVQKRITEAEKNGEKPNKSKIYDAVVSDMEKGIINIDNNKTTPDKASSNDGAFFDNEDIAPVQDLNDSVQNVNDSVQDIPIGETVSPTDTPTDTPTVSETDDVAPVAETTAENTPSAILYNKRDGANGWGEAYVAAQEALNDAVRYVNPKLREAFNNEIDNTPEGVVHYPITDAFIAVQEDVRQDTITPMQGARLLSETYNNGGVNALERLYNPATGNLYDQYLEKAKRYGTDAENIPDAVEESTFPKWADNEIASYKNDIAEARANAKPRKKPLFGALKRLVTTKPKGNESHHGVRTSDGKQYMSCNGTFVVELNTPDKSIIENEVLNVDGMKGVLERANNNAIEGNYKIDPIDITLIHKQVGNDNRSVVIVGENVYDIRFVDAVLQAIENPTVSLASLKPGFNFLMVKGSNGQAVIAPINHKVNSKTNGQELRYVYRAEKVDDAIAPVAETETTPEGFAPTTEAEANAMSSEILDSLTDADAPPEIDAPYYGERENATPSNPFARRDYTKVGNPKTKAYISENPDALPFFQEAATAMLGDLQNSQKGERWYNDRLYYESGGQEGIGGTRRETTADIADLLDGQYHYTYQQIEDALNAIINNKPLNACAKRIEFALNDRLLKGYTDIDGNDIPANQDYINLLSRQQTQEVYQSTAASEVFTDSDTPYAAEVPQTEAPAPKVEKPTAQPVEDVTPAKNAEEKETIDYIVRPDAKSQKDGWLSRTKKSINDAITIFGDKGWALENLSKKTGNRELEAKYDIMKNRTSGMAQEYIKDNLLPIYEKVEKSGKLDVFEDYAYNLLNIDRMSLDTEAAKTRRTELKKSLDGYDEKQIESMASETITRNTPQDRIALIFAAREYVDLGGAKGKNKPVYGDNVTADKSRKKVAEYEAANPEFKEYEQAVLEYNRQLRDMAVKNGLISQKTADLWAKMYPHYVPIRRFDKQGASVSVPLDTNKTGVNNPFKRATGGNKPFHPLFETMGNNTTEIIRAINRNRFGIELMETLQAANILDAKKAVDKKTRKAINDGKLPVGTKVRAHDRENIGVIESFDSRTGKYSVYFKNQQGHTASVKLDANILTPLGLWNVSTAEGANVDAAEVLESIDENDKAVLKEGKNGANPTFTVFKNGKRVEFDITEEIYNALKPTNEFLAKTSKPLNAMASGYKKLVTQYNPMFSFWRNPIKDTKDVLFNSQHAAKTYATAPKTIKEFATKGKYFEEFRKNGGMSGSYYDTQKKTFTKKPGIVRKVAGFPLKAYENVGEKFEMFWRLSEYIASRESGRSVAVSMLDAMRVTTNFAAGGDFTKWANRNGALFLNPSVQGAMQIGRNVREAYHEGAKGMAILAAKVLATGMGGLLFNWLLWDDDEDYKELSDYAKQNYFIVAKTEDGQFIRIPKGRMEAVIQNGFEQMQNLITGDDDVDMQTFAELVVNNLAPNNPLENNLIAPIIQAKNNKTWYGEDLVPTRLQDLPAAEQYDESTDIFSKWLGEKLGNAGLDVSPYKINYVLDQYSGGAGDVFLPMLTPEAESDNNLLAPIKDELTVDPVMKNQNVSDFYDKVDELKKNANSAYATDEDILSYKYMNSVNSELGELYAQKREIQNSDLSDKEKREAVRELQAQIDSIARESLGTYGNVNIDGGYANVGDIHYRVNKDGEWEKISDKQLEKQNAVTRGLGISASEYWGNKEEYDYAYDNPEKYTVAKAVGGYTAYRTYSSELYDIKGVDEDGDGKSDTGTRKANVLDYINNLDADYGEKIILFKSEYNADDTYNYDIIEYLNSREDISYDEMVTILKELGFTVHSNGTVTW